MNVGKVTMQAGKYWQAIKLRDIAQSNKDTAKVKILNAEIQYLESVLYGKAKI